MTDFTYDTIKSFDCNFERFSFWVLSTCDYLNTAKFCVCARCVKPAQGDHGKVEAMQIYAKWKNCNKAHFGKTHDGVYWSRTEAINLWREHYLAVYGAVNHTAAEAGGTLRAPGPHLLWKTLFTGLASLGVNS